MSTITLERPRHPAQRASERSTNFAGALGLLRLNLRRDRVVAPLWILLLGFLRLRPRATSLTTRSVSLTRPTTGRLCGASSATR